MDASREVDAPGVSDELHGTGAADGPASDDGRAGPRLPRRTSPRLARTYCGSGEGKIGGDHRALAATLSTQRDRFDPKIFSVASPQQEALAGRRDAFPRFRKRKRKRTRSLRWLSARASS